MGEPSKQSENVFEFVVTKEQKAENAWESCFAIFSNAFFGVCVPFLFSIFIKAIWLCVICTSLAAG